MRCECLSVFCRGSSVGCNSEDTQAARLPPQRRVSPARTFDRLFLRLGRMERVVRNALDAAKLYERRLPGRL